MASLIGAGSYHVVYYDGDVNAKRTLKDKSNLAQARGHMNAVLENEALRALLPTHVTNYDDSGSQTVTRCDKLTRKGRIGFEKTGLSDGVVSRMAREFLEKVNNLEGNGAAFDIKLDNLGCENAESGKIIRIIDVDVDDKTATFWSIDKGYDYYTNQHDSKQQQYFRWYQTLFCAIAAMLEWITDDKPDASVEKVLYNNWWVPDASKPRITFIRDTAQRIASSSNRWHYPETARVVLEYANVLFGFPFLHVDDSLRARFCDLGVM